MGRMLRAVGTPLFAVVSSVLFAVSAAAVFGFTVGRAVYDEPARVEHHVTSFTREGVPSPRPSNPDSPTSTTSLPVIPPLPPLPALPIPTPPQVPGLGPWDDLPKIPPAGLPAWRSPLGQYVCWNVYGFPFVQPQDHCPEGWVGRAPERPLPS